MEAFKSNVESLRLLNPKIEAKIKNLQNPDEVKQLPESIISEANELFEEADFILKGLSAGLKTLKNKDAEQIFTKLNEENNRLKSRFEMEKNNMQRDFLTIGVAGGSFEEQGRLKTAINQSKNDTKVLQSALGTLYQTEDEAKGIAKNIQEQGALMHKINEGIAEAEALYNSVKTTISKMTDRQIYIAMLWVGVGLVLIAAIILVIYFKWFRNKT